MCLLVSLSSSNVTKVCTIVISIKHLWCFLDSPKNLTCFSECEGLNKYVIEVLAWGQKDPRMALT